MNKELVPFIHCGGGRLRATMVFILYIGPFGRTPKVDVQRDGDMILFRTRKAVSFLAAGAVALW
jgi:hypothetical protein